MINTNLKINSLIIDLQYIPTISWLLNSIKYKNIKINIFEQSQKRSFRNKCYVVGSNGLICLTIPLVGGRDNKQKVKDIRINNNYKWQLLHWKTIESCYKKSPYYDYFEQVFKPFYQNQYEYLFDFNLKLTNLVLSTCKLDSQIEIVDDSFNKQDVIDMRYAITPQNYNEQNQYSYSQVFQEKIGFYPNVCCLDLFMNDALHFKENNLFLRHQQ